MIINTTESQNINWKKAEEIFPSNGAIPFNKNGKYVIYFKDISKSIDFFTLLQSLVEEALKTGCGILNVKNISELVEFIVESTQGFVIITISFKHKNDNAEANIEYRMLITNGKFEKSRASITNITRFTKDTSFALGELKEYFNKECNK